MKHNDEIRQLLNEITNTHKLSLNKLAKKTGISQPTLSRIRSGKTKRISAIVMLKLLEFKEKNKPKLSTQIDPQP